LIKINFLMRFALEVDDSARRFDRGSGVDHLPPLSNDDLGPSRARRAKPRTAAAPMHSARSSVRPRPRRSPIFVRRYQGPHAQSRAGTYDPDRTGGLPSSRPDRKHVRVGRHCWCGEIIDDLQRAQFKASMQITDRNDQPKSYCHLVTGQRARDRKSAIESEPQCRRQTVEMIRQGVVSESNKCLIKQPA
jgi:hypothetical protein